MPAPGPFDALAAQAHAEKVRAAVAEVLRATAQLAAVFQGRIYLLPDIWLPPDVQVPALTVGPAQEGTIQLTGGELEQEITVRIHAIYNEWRVTVGPTEKTISAVLSVVRSAIYDSYTLMVPAFSNVPLAKRIVRFNPTQYGLFEAGEPYKVSHVQTMEVVFEKNLIATTGVAS